MNGVRSSEPGFPGRSAHFFRPSDPPRPHRGLSTTSNCFPGISPLPSTINSHRKEIKLALAEIYLWAQFLVAASLDRCTKNSCVVFSVSSESQWTSVNPLRSLGTEKMSRKVCQREISKVFRLPWLHTCSLRTQLGQEFLRSLAQPLSAMKEC